MGYQKKAQKWAVSVGLPSNSCFWINGDSAPLKEFFAKMLSSEISRTSQDIVVSDPIPFEKLLSIAQYKLGIHTCLVGSDLAGNEQSLKLGLFGTVIFLKSALADYKPEIISQIPSPDFGIAGGFYTNKPICLKCGKDVMYIERIVVAEKTFHRSCMHCHLCGRRQFLGLFRIVAGNRLECFEHLVNQAFSGNELQSFENVKIKAKPPARPPPPTKKLQVETTPSNEDGKPASTNDQNVSAILETPTENKSAISPISTVSSSSKAMAKDGNGGSEHSGDGNWEMLSYPEQLNPFADEDADELSDNISCLNPFGDTSSDSESDVEHVETITAPVPAPRKLTTPKAAERTSAVMTADEKNTHVTNPISTEPKEVSKVEQKHVDADNKMLYPNLKNLYLDEDCESSFQFYMPSSLRLIDMSDYDKPKLLHELDKVIKTLDYIERSAKESERTLLKEIGKEGFKWEKNQILDSWAQRMKEKHDNLILGSMIVHAYMRKLLSNAIERIDRHGDQSVHANLRAQLMKLEVKLRLEDRTVAIPSVMEDMSPKVRESAKKKRDFVKRIKKSLLTHSYIALSIPFSQYIHNDA
ncbi:hypothetical protein M3Y98_00332900 [Aphelenchoides besseyi]|nr:hypothetical protein M3Y98_00332900 [Aphelenchoides besseyi]